MHLDNLEPLFDWIKDEFHTVIGQVDDQIDIERVLLAVKDVDVFDDPHHGLDDGNGLTKVHAWKQRK